MRVSQSQTVETGVQVLTLGNARGGNSVGDEGASALASAVLRSGLGTMMLNLKLNPISGETMGRIEASLQSRTCSLVDFD